MERGRSLCTNAQMSITCAASKGAVAPLICQVSSVTSADVASFPFRRRHCLFVAQVYLPSLYLQQLVTEGAEPPLVPVHALAQYARTSMGSVSAVAAYAFQRCCTFIPW